MRYPTSPPNTTRHGYTTSYRLGSGSYSHVWHATHSGTGQVVALKVTSEKYRTNELTILRTLMSKSSTSADWAHVVRLLDTFELEDGYGNNFECIALERMDFTARRLFETEGNSMGLAKEGVKQVLLGLKFIHSQGFVHSDIHPDNILIREGDYSNQVASHAPGTTQISVKISDLGAAFHKSQPPTDLSTPIALRSPEHVLLHRIDSSGDIWSLGCLLFEFATGRRLFNVTAEFCVPQEWTDDDHLLKMVDCLGPLPLSIATLWPRYSEYFESDAETDDNASLMLESRVDELKVREVENVLRKMLAYRHGDRPSSEELLNDNFFQS